MSLKNVHRRYRRGGFFTRTEMLHVLRGVDLELEEGASLGLVGRSGCGKSTLGRVALGLERPDKGSVCFRGEDIAASDPASYAEFRRSVQVVFQNVQNSVNPRMTAGEIVAEPMRNFFGLSKAEAVERSRPLLEQVGLKASDADKRPTQFSGGELQRVCIARALAPKPRVVVFDEAVSSLDMLVQARVLSLIEHIRDEQGLAFLFISHDLRVVAGLCREVALMADGVIAARKSSVKELVATGHPAIGELLASLPPAAPGR
ncbi:MAG: ATP-binding cassette domain-containing protein [Fretibacterium sp.]|nr:ATP-binding cassette domain-containing protein [Fretibacterium sp.]